MEGRSKISRCLIPAALLATALAVSSTPAITSTPPIPCDHASSNSTRVAGEGKQSENRPTREKCKRTPGSRTVPKGCPEGGERVPQEKRSPIDDAPPLTPLVA
jgi:hypothetical protein